MKELVKRAGLESHFLIDSAATSTEEIGNDTHYGTKNKLREQGIPFTRRAARQITAADYSKYDYLIGMDSENLYYMNRRWNNDPDCKIKLLLDFTSAPREVADPWYTGNFDQTFEDVMEGCQAMLEALKNEY